MQLRKVGSRWKWILVHWGKSDTLQLREDEVWFPNWLRENRNSASDYPWSSVIRRPKHPAFSDLVLALRSNWIREKLIYEPKSFSINHLMWASYGNGLGVRVRAVWSLSPDSNTTADRAKSHLCIRGMEYHRAQTLANKVILNIQARIPVSLTLLRGIRFVRKYKLFGLSRSSLSS